MGNVMGEAGEVWPGGGAALVAVVRGSSQRSLAKLLAEEGGPSPTLGPPGGNPDYITLQGALDWRFLESSRPGLSCSPITPTLLKK